MRALLCLFVIAACGSPAPAPAVHASAVSTVAPPVGSDDVVVAQVDGRPVWGSCVAAQVARGAADRRAALAECIDFELLAQAAERRGAGGAPEVAEAARQALVSRLVEVGFEDRYGKPDDLRQLVDRVIEHNRDQLDKPELRASTFARIAVPTGGDERARALAERIAGELANETGLFPSHLRDAANRLAEGTGLTVTISDFRPATREGLQPPYAASLFAIPEVGRIGKPARTDDGWDVILMTELVPAKLHTREEVAAQVFPELRRNYFQVWVNQIVRSLGVKIEIDQAVVARLDPPAPAGEGTP